jgi:hypothetical protein
MGLLQLQAASLLKDANGRKVTHRGHVALTVAEGIWTGQNSALVQPN